jgi:sugar lactone lactonase YvrE
MLKKAALIILTLSISCILADTVSFTQQPKAVKNGNSYTVTFAVTKPTDVEIAVLNGKGEIIRHLGAGMLGKNPPLPLKPGLSQTIKWDGKDNRGNPVAAAGCRIRVSLSLKPEFSRILGWKGEAVGGVSGIAIDKNGLAYILTHRDTKKPSSVHVFTRDGTYLKTILPYPADLPYEKVKDLGHVELSGNERVPVVRDPRYLTHYPDWHALNGIPLQTMCVVKDQLVMSSPWEMYSMNHTKLTNRRILIIGKDGSIPENFQGPFLADKIQAGHVHLAPVRGEQAVYATGLIHKKEWRKLSKSFHVVYKVDLNTRGLPKIFAGELNKPGNDGKHLNHPRGLAADRFGNLYVSDYGNSRIAVFKPDGTFMGQIQADRPGPLALHQKNNTIYLMNVVEHQIPFRGSRIQKLSPAVDAQGAWIGGSVKVLGATKEIKSQYQGYYVMAVDSTAEPTVIWLQANTGKMHGFLRIEEKEGTAFGTMKPVFPKGVIASGFSGFLAVDPEHEEVYSNLECGRAGNWKAYFNMVRINGRTGEITRMKIKGSDVVVGPDGYLYVLNRKSQYAKDHLLRFDREGNPVPFKATGNNILAGSDDKKRFYSCLRGPRGHCVDRQGNIYVMYPTPETKGEPAVVDVYGPDGSLKQKKLIKGSRYSTGLQADAEGNLYLADNVKNKTAVFPPEFKGKVPENLKWKFGINWYAWYGAVLKFPPAGGSIGKDTGNVYTTQCGQKPDIKADGVVWAHTGIYPMPGGGKWLGCTCLSARFGIDGFSRIFIPDAAACSVRVIDANANPLTRFGSYGNMDSQGPKSTVPVPEIAFAWPQYIAVSNEAVYISDVINRRIVRVNLNYETSKECEFK